MQLELGIFLSHFYPIPLWKGLSLSLEFLFFGLTGSQQDLAIPLSLALISAGVTRVCRNIPGCYVGPETQILVFMLGQKAPLPLNDLSSSSTLFL